MSDDPDQINVAAFTSLNDLITDLVSQNHTKSDVLNAIRDIELRFLWKSGAQCRVFSRKLQRWTDGEIIDIVIDSTTKKEWLTVKYKNGRKAVQRFSSALMPIEMDNDYQGNDVIIHSILRKIKIPISDENPMSSSLVVLCLSFQSDSVCVHVNCVMTLNVHTVRETYDEKEGDDDQKEDDDQEEEDETAQLRIGVLLSISEEIVDSLSEEHDENQILNVIEDLNLRFGWKQHDQCRVRSKSNGKWCDAQIVDIVIDEMTNNEWLTVTYEEQKAQINRFGMNVIPIGMDKDYQCNEMIIEYVLNEMGISYDQYDGNDPISLVTD